MEYISAKEAAERWGIQVRGVQELCKAGRIQGAFKFERSWMIPASAQKPEDPRRAGSKSSGAVSYGYYPGLISYFIHAPSGKSDRLPTGITDPAAILEYKAELLYFTGEIDACRDMLHGVDDGGTLLSRLSLVLPLSVCLGDVPAFNSAVEGVYALIDQAPDSVGSRAARLLHSCTALGLYMPHFVPEWIRDGQFAGLPAELIPFAIYTRSKYLLTAKREAEAKAAAETALSFLPVESGFSLIHLYLRLICSAALCAAGDMHASEAHLRETMSLAMPYDYVIPFTEFLTLHSGLIESVSQQEYPEQYRRVIQLWTRCWKNWMAFRGRLTMSSATAILSNREHHLTRLLADDLTYAEAAERLGMSVGSVKNMASVIYAKLHVGGKTELKDYVL